MHFTGLCSTAAKVRDRPAEEDSSRNIFLNHKLISYTSDGMKIFGITAIQLKVFPEIQYKIVYGAGGGVYVIPPYCL